MSEATGDMKLVDISAVEASGSEAARIVEEIRKLPHGKAAEFSVPQDCNYRDMIAALHVRANRIGIPIHTRRSAEDKFHAYRAADSLRPKRIRRSIPEMAERNEQIAKAIDAMKSYEEVAKQFGLTRQRIEQIYLTEEAKKFTHLTPGNGRRTALLEFMQPYIDACQDPLRCLACGEECKDTIGALCKRCRKARSILARIKWHIRAHIENSAPTARKGFSLTNAVCEIRRHGVQPEDLRFV